MLLVSAITQRVASLESLKLALAFAEDSVQEDLLEYRFLHQVGKVAVLLSVALDPVVVGQLDDLSPPERALVIVNLSPKAAAPLKVLLVDVEVVGVGEAAEQRWRERNKIRSAIDGQLRLG